MKIKNKVIGISLALGAAFAPLAVKANTETNAAPKAVEITTAEKTQKLKEAIHLGLPREELLKYVDFPEWMPVTKDGKYDSDKAREMFKNAGLDESENQQAFINYVDAVEKGENADIAFQKLAKQITNGDAEKMAALNKIKNALQETQKRTPKEAMESNFGWTWFTVGVLAAALAMFMSDKLRDVDAKGLSKVSTMLGVMATLFTGLGIANDGSIYKPYSNVSKQIYNAYVNQEIQKAANPEIVKMDAKQTRQFIELAKQNGPEK